MYWFFLIQTGINPNIIRDVYDTGFFTVNEGLHLFFDLFLIFRVLRFMNRNTNQSGTTLKKNKALRWLYRFSFAYLTFTAAHLLILFNNRLFNYHDLRLFYYPILLANSFFIYWIGYLGFINPSLFFSKPLLEDSSPMDDKMKVIQEKLAKAIREEVFRNSKLTITDLANQLNLSPKELSGFINRYHQMNFSEFLNFHRTEKAKTLLQSKLAKEYTLVALAKEAGFNSKSSFNETFKKLTGLTPTQFKRSQGR